VTRQRELEQGIPNRQQYIPSVIHRIPNDKDPHGSTPGIRKAHARAAALKCVLEALAESLHRLLAPQAALHGIDAHRKRAFLIERRVAVIRGNAAREIIKSRMRYAGTVASRNFIQTGAWSLAFAHPRTCRSTPASTKRLAIAGLRRIWSIRNPASRVYALRK
jgi:hypothetical protein